MIRRPTLSPPLSPCQHSRPCVLLAKQPSICWCNPTPLRSQFIQLRSPSMSQSMSQSMNQSMSPLESPLESLLGNPSENLSGNRCQSGSQLAASQSTQLQHHQMCLSQLALVLLLTTFHLEQVSRTFYFCITCFY